MSEGPAVPESYWYDGPEDGPEFECSGLCLTGADIGVPEGNGVAYAHPDCELHGRLQDRIRDFRAGGQ